MNQSKKMGVSIIGLGVALAALSVMVPSHARASNAPTRGNLFYSRFFVDGDPNRVKEVNFTFDGSTLTLGTKSPVAKLAGADGITFAPNGDLLVGGQGPTVYKVNTATSAVTSVASGTLTAFHTSLDPSGKKVWIGDGNYGFGGSLSSVPLDPFAAGTNVPITGDEHGVDTIAWDTNGTAYYTASRPNGTNGAAEGGHFGVIDLATGHTTRKLTTDAAHGMAFDSYTGNLLIFGSNQVEQIKTSDFSVVSSKTFSDLSGDNKHQFDQGSVDGQGHVFIADNNGGLTFIDYSASHKVGDSGNFFSTQFLDTFLDDVAPLSGPGAAPITTTPSDGGKVGTVISDTAHINGFVPSGSVTFDLFGPAQPDCKGVPAATSVGAVSGAKASSGPFTTTEVGTYRWVATYSGDKNNTPSVSGCQDEQVTTTGGGTGGVTATPSPTGGVQGITTPNTGNGSGTSQLAGVVILFGVGFVFVGSLRRRYVRVR